MISIPILTIFWEEMLFLISELSQKYKRDLLTDKPDSIKTETAIYPWHLKHSNLIML